MNQLLCTLFRSYLLLLIPLVCWHNTATAADNESKYALDAFAGFQPAGRGTPDTNWLLHLTDIPYFFGKSKVPTVHAGYDAFLYPDGTVLLVEYRQSQDRVFERITEWTASARETKQLQELIEKLVPLAGTKQASKKYQRAMAQQSLTSKWEYENILTFSTSFSIKEENHITQIELFDLPDQANPLTKVLWEAADILKPLPPLSPYGNSTP